MKQIVKIISKKVIIFFIGLIAGISLCASASVLFSSSDVSYDNNATGMSSTNVQDAIDELFNTKTIATNQSGDIVQIYNERLASQKISKIYGNLEMKRDIAGDYYFDFDGVDDYIQLDTLPASINWQDGFTVEFKAAWTSANNWTRIFDFGNGRAKQNILFGRYNTTNTVGIALMETTDTSTYTASISTDTIELNKTLNIKVEVYKEGTYYKTKLYLDNVLNKETTTTISNTPNVERTLNYIGKANWSELSLFKGRIYNLKIKQADGEQILDIDVNKLATGSMDTPTGVCVPKDLNLMQPTDVKFITNAAKASWYNFELGYIPRYIIYDSVRSDGAYHMMALVDTINKSAFYYTTWNGDLDGEVNIDNFYKKVNDTTISLFTYWADLRNNGVAYFYK